MTLRFTVGFRHGVDASKAPSNSRCMQVHTSKFNIRRNQRSSPGHVKRSLEARGMANDASGGDSPSRDVEQIRRLEQMLRTSDQTGVTHQGDLCLCLAFYRHRKLEAMHPQNFEPYTREHRLIENVKENPVTLQLLGLFGNGAGQSQGVANRTA